MYNRDYVKSLEREIELTGDNRFQGWRLTSENASQSRQEANPQDSNESGPSEAKSSAA